MKDLNLLIDGRSLATGAPAGVARFTQEMIHVALLAQVNVTVITNKCISGSIKLPANVKLDQRLSWSWLPGFLFIMLVVPVIIRDKSNIFWGVNHTIPLFGMKTIVSIHDFVCFKHPETMTFYNKMATRISTICSLIFCDLIAPVSIKTKIELEQMFPRVLGRQVLVISNVVDSTLFHADTVPRVNDIVIIGSLEPRKNIVQAINAFNAIRAAGERYKLRIIGGRSWGETGIESSIASSEYSSDITVEGFVTDHQLAAIYRQCALLLFPSIYEGFGLPPFEALCCGCAVLASVNGELINYVNAQNHKYLFDGDNDSLSALLLDALNNPEKYKFNISAPSREKVKIQLLNALSTLKS